MKFERTKNATKNIIFGGILKIYQIIIPFLMRTAMIYFMGVEYLGLNSLFTSILQVLNLAELGIGSAMVFSMYKPIANDNGEKICALMNLYKIYYRIIGTVILIIGIAICPFIPKLIKGNIPENMNVYILYILNLLATVFSYWLFAYKNSLLQAHQRSDILSKITLIINTVQYICQFIMLYFYRNYYLYVIILLVSQIAINIFTAIITNKMYPEYKAKGMLERNEIRKINQRVKDLFTSKVGNVIVNSADTIVISSFLGLTVLAVYQNYYYILTALIGIVQVIFTSCTAGIGNSIITETPEKNYRDFKKFTFLIMWIAGVCSCELLCLYQQFMNLWVGKDLMLNFIAVVLLCIYYFVYEVNALFNLYKDAGGIWHKDRYRPLITALTNLVLNLILVKIIGIYGIILSTVLSTLVIGMPWLISNLFSEIFKIKPWEYIKNLIKYVASILIIVGIVFIVTLKMNRISLDVIILKGLICLMIFNILFFIVWGKKDETQDIFELIKKITKKSKI